MFPMMATPGIFSPAALIGGTGNSGLVAQINQRMGSTLHYANIPANIMALQQQFHQQVIVPMAQCTLALQNITQAVNAPDQICAMSSFESFYVIPTAMQLPIVMYQPVRDLLAQGRISGFGYSADCLPEDYYARLIANGTVSYGPQIDSAPMPEMVSEWQSSDPRLNIDEIDAIEETRHTIDRMLATTDHDPTAFPSYRS